VRKADKRRPSSAAYWVVDPLELAPPTLRRGIPYWGRFSPLARFEGGVPVGFGDPGSCPPSGPTDGAIAARGLGANGKTGFAALHRMPLDVRCAFSRSLQSVPRVSLAEASVISPAFPGKIRFCAVVCGQSSYLVLKLWSLIGARLLWFGSCFL